ncbi:MAG TPA: anti-sigma factor [Gemmatimonadota bacterium]|nr:anti-sigma factor [Gemmatimonadota bacterium]
MSEIRPRSIEEFQELAIAHLLGELDPAGQAAFDAELARRGAEGRAAVRRLGETMGDLALAAAPAEPPPSLRSRVLAIVGHEGEPRGRAAPGAPSWLWAAAAVLAVLTIGLGVWAARLVVERNRLLEGIERMNEARSADYDSARERVAALQEKLDFMGGPASAVHPLVGTQALPEAGARVFLDPVTGRAILFAYDLPVLSVDQLYELWAIGPEGPRPAGVFRPNDSGRARLEIEDPELLRNVQMLAVTVEPAPGTDQPTGEIILSSGRS